MIGFIKSITKKAILLSSQFKDNVTLKSKLCSLPEGDFFLSPTPSYSSQHALNNDWKKQGWNSFEDYQYWETRTCAIVCLKMILSAHENDYSIADLAAQGIDLGGYNTETDQGWFHYPLVNLAKQLGMEGRVERYLGISRIVYELSQNHFVIASVDAVKLNHLLKNRKESHLPKAPTVKHMILLIGYRWKQNHCDGVFFFNPTYPNVEGNKPFFLRKKMFLSVFNRRGITVWR